MLTCGHLYAAWLQRGGIVGRGVLLDYAAWAERKGIRYRADTKHHITYQDLEQVAAEQGVELRPADILIMRTGWIRWYQNASAAERHQSGHVDHKYCGFEGTAESVEWLWNHKFAAIAADNMAVEAWPATNPYRKSFHDFHGSAWLSDI